MINRVIHVVTTVFAVGVVTGPATALAQDAPSSAPRSDTLGAFAEVTSWPQWPGAPLRFSVAPFDVVVTTPLSRAWLAAHDDPRATARTCPGLDLLPSDTAEGRSFIQWTPAEGSAAAPDASAEELAQAVIITIAPVPGSESPCRGYSARSPGAIAEGVAFQRYAVHNPGADVVGATVSSAGGSAMPLRVERALQHLIFPKGAHAAAPAQSIVRIFMRPESFAADPSGRLDAVQIAVTRAQGGGGIALALPYDVRRQVHRDLLAATIARSDGSGGATDLALPVPRDARLRHAIAIQRSGDVRAAALLYHVRLYDPMLDETIRREATVRLALALAALGDSSDARAIAAQVVGREPCFTLATSLPSEARALFRNPDAARLRCSHRLPAVVAASLLFPGLGHLHSGRRGTGVGVAVVTTAAFAFAASRHARSGDEYDSYMGATSTIEARSRYARAAASRDDALRAAIVGASLWAASALEAGFAEMRHADAMRAVRDYGGGNVSIAPVRGGLAISIPTPW